MIASIDLSLGSAAVADDVRDRCEEVGFLTVTGHSVPAELIESVAGLSRAFFDLPDQEKARYRAPAEAPGMPVYRPLGAEKLGANADQKASLDWGPSLAGVAWPNAELRAAYERYFAEMLRVAEMLVHGTRYEPVRAGDYVLSRAAAAGL